MRHECRHHGLFGAEAPASFIHADAPYRFQDQQAERDLLEALRPVFDSFFKRTLREWPTCPHGALDKKGKPTFGAVGYRIIPERERKVALAQWWCVCGGGWYE